MNKHSYNEILKRVKGHEYIIIDAAIMNLYPDIKDIVLKKCSYSLENPEKSKNIDKYHEITEFFLQNKITRNDELLVIGGGATSDLGGFVASTLLRGISWKVIPTTLLSMIDASIGGKTGINSKFGKNLIGSFHLPKSVNLCPKFLDTLSEDDYFSGMGELVKYIYLSSEINKLVETNKSLEEIILACACYKEEIVEKDFKEGSFRKLLNFGHTFGHAIEKVLNIPHGKAVLFGIEMILKLYSPQFIDHFYKVTKRLNISFSLEEKISFDDFVTYLESDKKRVNQHEIELIIATEIGKCEIQKHNFSDVIKEIKDSELFKNFFK